MSAVLGTREGDLRITTNNGVTLVNMEDVATAISIVSEPFRFDKVVDQLPFVPFTREDVEGMTWMSVADLMKMLYWISSDISEEQAARIESLRRCLRPKVPNKRAVARKNRWMVAFRQKYMCAACGVLLHPKGFDIDHIMELRDGGKDEMANLQALCGTCHAKKTRTR